ncbi:MAG TPA: hypothetical protein VG963_09485, partial [Polyangiaceae bacterium]|nr:hypothetical protein [Polyangiaceae bacterium]
SNASAPRATPGTGIAIEATATVGIALQDDLPPPIRPRFKTLLGVPRNDPNLELYADNPLLNAALLEADAGDAAELASLHDPALGAGQSGSTASSKTSAVVDAPVEAPAALEDAAAPEVRAEPAAATDSVVPIEKFSSTVRVPREAHVQFTAITPGSFDLRADVAALRRTGRRTGWLLAIGGMCAAAVVVTFYPPGEWRMLLSAPAPVPRDDAALLITSWQATQTLAALRPTISSGQSAAASAAFPATTASDIAAGQQGEATPPSELEHRGDGTKQTNAAWSPSAARSSSLTSASSGASGSTERAAAPSGSSKSLRTPNAKAPRTEHSHAAPRKLMAGRGAHEQARMKAPEARQNPPRNAGGNGIIRDTPF